MTIVDDAREQADAIKSQESEAFRCAMKAEMDAAMAAWGEQLSKHY